MSRTAPAIAISSVPMSVIGPSSSGEVLMLKRDGVLMMRSRALSESGGWMALRRCAKMGRRDFAWSIVRPGRRRALRLSA